MIDKIGFLSTDPNRVCALLREFQNKLPIIKSWPVTISKVNSYPEISNYLYIDTVLAYDIYARESEYCFVRNVRGGTAKSFLFLSGDFNHANLCYNDEHDFFGIREITVPLYQGFRYYALNNKCYMLHSSAVKNSDGCILFCGQSGAGKSTQADLWAEYTSFQIMSYDQNCLYFTKDGTLIAQTTPWGGKEDYYWDTSSVVKAIVFLEKADSDSIQKLTAAEAYAMMYLSNYLFPLNERIDEENQRIILKIVRKVPAYRLKCTKTKDAVLALEKELCV